MEIQIGGKISSFYSVIELSQVDGLELKVSIQLYLSILIDNCIKNNNRRMFF